MAHESVHPHARGEHNPYAVRNVLFAGSSPRSWGTPEKYLRKGQPVLLEGRIQVRTYEKDGQKRYATEIVADDITLLGRSSDNSGGAAAPAASAYPELEDTFPLDISDTLDPMADDFPFGNDPNA